MPNKKLGEARAAKNDEFYTGYEDIQREVNAYLDFNPDTFRNKTVLLPADDPEWSNFTRFFAQNFEMLGLKKLISTSYAADSKPDDIPYQLTFFEEEAPQFDQLKTRSHGKIFTLTRAGAKKVDIDDLKWKYLEGDGDFRSDEVKALRDQADIIVTNPPFSLFREFLDWIMEANKQFLIIGNVNCITYKEVFPRIKDNQIWIGNRMNKRIGGKNMIFRVPDNYPLSGTEVFEGEDGKKYISVAGTGWFTNLDHGRRHEPLQLMTMEDNLRYSKHKDIRENGYLQYFNYDGIDIPYTDAIPNDYTGVMGVPVTFLDKYCPDQFEIIDSGSDAPKTMIHTVVGDQIQYIKDGEVIWSTPYTVTERKIGNGLRISENGMPGKMPYGRILIRKKV